MERRKERRDQSYLSFLHVQPLFWVVLGSQEGDEIQCSKAGLSPTRHKDQRRLKWRVCLDGWKIGQGHFSSTYLLFMREYNLNLTQNEHEHKR